VTSARIGYFEVFKSSKTLLANAPSVALATGLGYRTYASHLAVRLISDGAQLRGRADARILAQTPSDHALVSLTAGPLEDLLSRRGPFIIERVELEARRNPAFANRLGGARQHTMPDDIWARVAAVWDRRGWDGLKGFLS